MVSSSIHSSTWWLTSPIDNIRDKFTELDRSRQLAVIVILIIIVIVLTITSIVIIVRRVPLILCPRHNNQVYIPLDDVDMDEDA